MVSSMQPLGVTGAAHTSHWQLLAHPRLNRQTALAAALPCCTPNQPLISYNKHYISIFSLRQPVEVITHDTEA